MIRRRLETTRRRLLKTLGTLPLLACVPAIGNAQDAAVFSRLKTGYAQRLKKILRSGNLPYIDIEALIGRFPNLHFDTAFGDAASIYPLSSERHARVWTAGGDLKAEWRDLIATHPKRFLSALDLGGDRMHRIAEYDQKHRDFLRRLPAQAQRDVAYRSAWSLLFGEEFA